jgi:PAS domain S-box-containing protein
MPPKRRSYSLSARLVLSLVVIVVVAATGTSLPLYWLIHTKLMPLSAVRQAAFILIMNTLAVILIGSALAVLLGRRLTAPLRELTAAARKIGQGDLDTPIPKLEAPVEIFTLATVLEESRINMAHTLSELSEAKVWSESLIQSLVEGVVTFDTRGRVTFFSRGAERITGWASPEVLGEPLNSVFPLPDGEDGQFTDHIPPCGGKREIRVLGKGGQPLTLAVTGARLIPPASSATQVALVLRDITEEEAIRNLRSYFLANISHEFRTPLSSLNASLELLLDEADHLSSEEMNELLQSIHLSALGLQTLIDNLLESTSIEAGRFAIHCHPLDPNEAVAEAIRVMQPLLDRRQQLLSVTEPTQLPAIRADRTRLIQVLVNLLSNASKYSPLGSTIDLTLERTGDNALRISIADRGPGIPPADRANLFRRFIRLGAQDSTQYGVGLGLSVVKAIVEGHGGMVGVEERTGGGSVFWFTIPILGDRA